ncbi:hypothetical protein HanXRQr2_Chr06g0264981 [Helianthus annuus]|uniref:Uncharacterized protein n=1 Tax=Helianthus annuus TaxID=4232 RepID=A0A9K3IVK7_HELAN|nr:hypothetical protein HanXRQr2_Chr06g0264981 [Helianthus annuus]
MNNNLPESVSYGLFEILFKAESVTAEDGLWLCHRKVNLQRIGTRAKYDLNGGGD